MRQAFPPDNFLASDDVSTLLIFSWFIFKAQPTPKQPEEIVRRDKKKGPEEIPGLRHFG
jgi:hypothetical protein